MEKKWIFPDGPDNSGDILFKILEKRGITKPDEIADFLAEKPMLHYDPFLLKDGEAAARRILEAITAGERICVYGDYDADGICAVALMSEILTKLGAKYNWYIPSRFEEGYGLNCEAIEAIAGKGGNLIVTVDCGSVSASEVEFAKQLGLTVIVTDHHNLNENPAKCLLVNPKQKNCAYPEKELSGCGVAFKLAQILTRLAKEYEGGIGGILSKADLAAVLDLVAIATIGDIVSLLGENRSLVKYGLRAINAGRRPGLAELIRQAGFRPGEIRAEQVAYAIVPHLNAGGRMQTAETGVTLLTQKDGAVLREAAALLVQNNRERKRIQEENYRMLTGIVEKQHADAPVLLIDSADIHEGIAGIVAGKLKETYYRPTILLTPAGDDCLKGTGRSIEGINLYEMLSAGRELFLKFGGHAGACGFLLRKENLPALRKILLDFAESIKKQNPEVFVPKIVIDEVLAPEDLTIANSKRIEKLEPFGQKNPRPLLCIRNRLPAQPVYLGEEQQHVRFTASGIPCILFGNAASYRLLFEKGAPVDLCGYADINRWNGTEKIQFVVLAMRCYNEDDC